MPADFDDVGARLDRLGAEAEGVEWAGVDAVRQRGRQRAHRRAVTGTLVVCMGVATLGISVTGNLPGQEGFLNNAVPIAGIPTEQRTLPQPPSDEPDRETGAVGTEPDTDEPDPTGQGPSHHGGSSPTDTRTPSDDPTTSPTTPDASPTDPTESPTPEPTDTPSPPPTVEISAVPEASELPSLAGVDGSDRSDGSWSEVDNGTGEGVGQERWLCSKSTLSDLGAVSSAWRDFAWDSDTQTVTAFSAAAAFDAEADAESAYDDLAGSVSDCSWGTVGEPTSVSLDNGQAEWWQVETETEFHVVGLVQRGSAVTYVVWHDDDSAEDDYTNVTMTSTLRAAATLLEPWDE